MKEKLKKAYPDDKDYETRLNGKRKEFALALKEFSTSEKVQPSILSPSKNREQEKSSQQKTVNTPKDTNLGNKNEKLLEVSTKSGKHGNYAAASFVLALAFAVGASLTIFNPAICITLAVAASVFLALGCHCLYKANTTLSDVKVDQQDISRLLESSL